VSITWILVSLAGAVALLLWGVHMVQTGVERAFGPSLRRWLGKALSNRFKAFIAGLGVTAILQSSTATGLMVSGFAAAGLVSLPAALAVMLGANVGTTLIVQFLAFDVSAAAPPLILLGFIAFRRGKASYRDAGRVLIGLGLLLLALHQFLALLAPLSSDPMVRAVLTRLAPHIVFLVLLGAILTVAAHSSIAIVLLAMSLAAHGVLPPAAAIALVLGANLGSAVNPVLEGTRGRDRAGERLPVGNLANRLVGVIACLLAFPWLAQAAAHTNLPAARLVAGFHTAFNLALALLFFPWLGAYARLLERWLPARAGDAPPGTPLYLDASLREQPSLALGAAKREALRMADVLETMLLGLKDALTAQERHALEETRRLDDVLDRLNTATKAYVLSLDPKAMGEDEAIASQRVLAFSINLEQAGDLIDRNLLGMAARRVKRGLTFSPEGVADLGEQVDHLVVNTRQAAAVFLSGDEAAARALATQKAAFREIEGRATQAHFERLRSGDVATIETSSLHLDALRDLKRVNAHLVEAAAYPILQQRGDLLPTRLKPRAIHPQA